MANYYGNNYNNLIHTTLGNDLVHAYGGNDWINMYGGNDVLHGGAGNDTLSYLGLNKGVAVNLGITTLQNTGVGSLIQTGFENLVGSNFNDRLTGNIYANNLSGEAGNDSLFGMGGNDTISGGRGNDLIDGGAGQDTASYQFAKLGVIVDLAITGWQNTQEGLDKLVNVENLFGSKYGDVLIGNASNNVINGGDGNDFVWGDAGNDTLIGGNGYDTFVWDPIDGEGGTCDWISDYSDSYDVIDVTLLYNAGIISEGSNFLIDVFDCYTTVTVEGYPQYVIKLAGQHYNLSGDDFVVF